MKVAEKLQYIALKIIDWFLIEPKRLVRLVVLSICSVVVFFQLSECFMKLLHPPISTHSHFDLNETMHYPAVTICREPGFKEDVMHVRSCWLKFSCLVTFGYLKIRNTICLTIRRSHRAGRIFFSKTRHFRCCSTRQLTPKMNCS